MSKTQAIIAAQTAPPNTPSLLGQSISLFFAARTIPRVAPNIRFRSDRASNPRLFKIGDAPDGRSISPQLAAISAQRGSRAIDYRKPRD
jgi:hypothetical protein